MRLLIPCPRVVYITRIAEKGHCRLSTKLIFYEAVADSFITRFAEKYFDSIGLVHCLQKPTKTGFCSFVLAHKAGHRSNLASLRFRVNAATERRKHTQVDFLWITQRFRTIAVFPINWERLDASVFTSMLPATKGRSRTFATR